MEILTVCVSQFTKNLGENIDIQVQLNKRKTFII